MTIGELLEMLEKYKVNPHIHAELLVDSQDDTANCLHGRPGVVVKYPVRQTQGAHTGWVCPVCGSGNAPWAMTCCGCGPGKALSLGVSSHD